jgi:type I restriction enzyme S subunit
VTKTATVKELAEQIRGVSYAKNDASNTPGPGLVPVLRAGNITDNGLVCDRDLVYVPQSKVSPKQRIRKFDIVIAASSGSISIVGKAAQAQEDLAGSFGAFCKVLRPNASVEPNYFSHYFKTPSYRRHVSSLAAGANINNLRNQDLDDLLIPLPPLSEQKRIAEILDRTESLRRQRRAALALLDELTQSIFLDMFGDASQEWDTAELQHVVRDGTIVTYGIVQAGEEFEGGVPYIRTGDIVNGEIARDGLRHTDPAIAAKFNRSRVDAGDIVMSIRATVGTTAVVPPCLDGANLTQGTAKIAPGARVEQEYLLHFLRSNATQHWIGRQIKGATFREITLGRLRQLPVVVPPIELQRCFSSRMSSLRNIKTSALNSAVEVDSLFASLQHRAFRGEL